MTRVVHVVTNVGHFDDGTHRTGLWLSELTHAWEVFERAGLEQAVASPAGGVSPLDPRSLLPGAKGRSARRWQDDPARMALLASTVPVADVEPEGVDVVYLTGGHGVMYDFPGSTGLQHLVAGVWSRGGVVSAVCHGYCGLLDVTLDDGAALLSDRRLTGFSWREEVLAGVARRVPFDAEQAARDRGAHYVRGRLPFLPHTVTEGRLVTGQNPASARATAQGVLAVL